MEKQYEFTIITMTDESNTKGGLPFETSFKQKISMSSEVFSENLTLFLKNLSQVLEKQPESIGNGFSIDEIELNLTINASGGIELIGKAEVGVQSAITIKLKKG
jgi:hypothetical protein